MENFFVFPLAYIRENDHGNWTALLLALLIWVEFSGCCCCFYLAHDPYPQRPLGGAFCQCFKINPHDHQVVRIKWKTKELFKQIPFSFLFLLSMLFYLIYYCWGDCLCWSCQGLNSLSLASKCWIALSYRLVRSGLTLFFVKTTCGLITV